LGDFIVEMTREEYVAQAERDRRILQDASQKVTDLTNACECRKPAFE
jgi:hypothetical protein